jgi:hydroxypyruvate isomerase
MAENVISTSFCLEMLYGDLPFMARLSAAREDGIDGIEFWDYRDKDLAALQKAVKENHLRVMNFSGNRLHGMLCSSEREPLLNELAESIKIARRLQCRTLMLLVQPLRDDGSAITLCNAQTGRQKFSALVECAIAVAALAEEADIDIVIEPLNTLLDHPGYFLNRSQSAFECIKEVDHPRIKVLYDIYHMAAMGEPVLKDIETHLDKIGYIHAADLPGRHEPGTGLIDYKGIFSLLRTLKYDKTVGFEFWPSQAGSSLAIKNTLRSLECS